MSKRKEVLRYLKKGRYYLITTYPEYPFLIKVSKPYFEGNWIFAKWWSLSSEPPGCGERSQGEDHLRIHTTSFLGCLIQLPLQEVPKDKADMLISLFT